MLIMAFAAVSSIALPLKGHMVSNMQEQIPSDDCCCSAAFYSVPLGACFASVFTSLAHDLTEASQALTPSTATTPRGAARRAVLRKNPRSPRLGLCCVLHAAQIQIPGGAAAHDAIKGSPLAELRPLRSRHPFVCLPPLGPRQAALSAAAAGR